MSRGAAGLIPLCVLACWPTFAHAQGRVITPERAGEIQALFLPHALGREVVPGWTLDEIAISERTIRVVVVGTGGRGALVLSEAEAEPTVPSFAVAQEGDDASVFARAALLEALRANDAGTFWATAVVPSGTSAGAASPIASRSTPWVPVTVAVCAVVACAALLFRHRSSRGPAP